MVAVVAGVLAIERTLVGVFYDDGLYAGIAVALANGEGYVHPHLPGAPAAVHYPPLYPLVLAPLFGALSVDHAALAAKIMNLFFGAATAALVAWHAARVRLVGDGAPPWLPAAVVTAGAVAIPVLATQAVLFSEPLYAILLALAVACADRPPERWNPFAGALAAGCLAALSLLTRSLGVAVGGGVVLYLLLVRRAPWIRALAAAAPVGLAALGWGAWVTTHQGGIDPWLVPGYGGYFGTLRQTGLAGLGERLLDLPRPLVHDLTLYWLPATPLYLAFAAAAVAVGLYGLALCVRRSAIGAVLCLYVPVLLIWPYPADRFIWFVLPWLALAWTAGLVGLWRRLPRIRVGLAVLAGSIALGYLGVEARGFAGRLWGVTARRVSANYADLLPWVAGLPSDAVVATDGEALVWLYTRRRSVPFFIFAFRGRAQVRPTPAEHRAYLERMAVTHVLLADPRHGSADELDRLLGDDRGWLTMVHGWPDGRAAFVVRHER